MRVALDALCEWSRRRERALIIGTVAAGAALRALLVACSPVPFGYVWDPYHAGVAILFSTGRLPVADDCWACFHPSLYYLLGWPFYAAGRWLHPQSDEMALRLLGGLAIVSAAITIYYGQRLLRLFRCRGASFVLGLALLVLFPCLFISSYAPEADIVLTAILTAFLYYLVKYCAQPSRVRPLDVVRIGALAGCAAATKYSGLLAPLTIAIVMGLQVLGLPIARRTTSRRALKHAVAMLLIAGVIGGWKYVDNARRYGTALHANGSASEGFTIGGDRVRGADYELTTLRLGGLRRLFGPRPPEGELTTFPVYFSVWTSLHALAWSDMSFFSVPSRHGDPSHPYPRKSIPVALVMSVIVLGFVPELLAVLGFVRMLRHRSTWPIAIFVTLGAASYVWWFLPQQFWALKTKYILFLLPAGVLYAMAGLGWLRRRQPVVSTIAAILLVALIALTSIYLYAFAVGRPSPRIVGDGAEYVAMSINFAELRGPAIAPADLDRLQHAIAEVDSRFGSWDIRGSTVASRDRRRDFAHFWIYPLMAAPFVWMARLAGASPLIAFTVLNVCLLMAALWIAVPRIGSAAAALLFVSPVIWWIDKPHTEVFTFALLAIAFLTLRDRPWWSMAASGLASAQNPPIALVTLLTAIGHLLRDRRMYRDRRFQAGVLAAGGLCLLQPLYTYARHGTPSLLTLQNSGHTPVWAEIAAVPFDPAIGLAAHVPGLMLALIIATVFIVRTGRYRLGMEESIALAAAFGFVLAFSQAVNVHHGGTPGLSRYAVWLMPLTIPVFVRLNDVTSAQRWLWPIAILSAVASVFMYGPAVPENAREPSLLARHLWTRHPGWNNPLPEVFAEVSAHQEVRSAPIWTRDCEKVLLIGRGNDAPFPIPCVPAPVPDPCKQEGALCYANRDGNGYRFVRAPGSAVAWAGFAFEADRVWPAGSEPVVRDLLEQAEWWTLHVRSGDDAALRFARGVRVTELQGQSRLVFILRDIRSDAEVVLRVPSRMRGTLTDAMTRRVITELEYSGPPLAPWRIAVPSGPSLLILTLSAS